MDGNSLQRLLLEKFSLQLKEIKQAHDKVTLGESYSCVEIAKLRLMDDLLAFAKISDSPFDLFVWKASQDIFSANGSPDRENKLREWLITARNWRSAL